MRRSMGCASALLALTLVAGTGGLLAGCSSSEGEGEAASDAAVEETSGAAEGQEAAGDQAAAEALIGQSLTRDEIEAAVGSGERFEMSSAGCERGVYGGYFYYDGFSIFSRTYDKGGTFTVVSVDAS